MSKKNIAIIGVGNMGRAIANGLFTDKSALSGGMLFLSDPALKENGWLRNKKNAVIVGNMEAVQKSKVVILAVKPQAMMDVLADIKTYVTKNQLIISIAAGIEIKGIKSVLGKNIPVVRVMPNICATVGKSMSTWTKSKEVTETQEKAAAKILQSIGREIFVKDEAMLDVATAVAGSGPAYFFYMAELLEKWARLRGFAAKDARILAEQTYVGSAQLLEQAGDTAYNLRRAVTSKKGTTEAAFKVLKKTGFQNIFFKALAGARRRAEELRRGKNKG